MTEVSCGQSFKNVKVYAQRRRRSVLEYKRTHTIGYYIKVNFEEELILREGLESHRTTTPQASPRLTPHEPSNERTPLIQRPLNHRSALDDSLNNSSCNQTYCKACFCGISKRLLENRLIKQCDIWFVLTVVALTAATMSFSLQRIVEMMFIARHVMLSITTKVGLQYLLWVFSIVCPVWFAVKFVHLVAPQSAGSGIPEIKAIIKGVEVKDFLTFDTLIAKIVGLIMVSGAGLPLGKEAAFIHVAAIVAILMSGHESCVDSFSNELKRTDLLISACAAGLSAALISPIGSFLAILEINSTYFAQRHYWHSFYGSAVATVIVSVLHSWVTDQPNIMPYFSFDHKLEFSYDGRELLFYCILGFICGLLGVLYVWCHKKYALFLQSNDTLKKMIKRYCCPYSIVITLVIATITFPKGLGQYLAVEIDSVQQIEDLFSNFSWTGVPVSLNEATIIAHWTTAPTNILWSLVGFFVFTFIFSIVASTMPVPSGLLIPVFKAGAAFGRLFGELVNLYGIPVLPGAYAIAGAAAFTGSVTHAVSAAIIAIEVTGHITTILPIIVAVVTANSVAFFMSISLHDTIMLIKGLPYLPNLITCGSTVDNIYVDEFMVKDVHFITRNTTYYNIHRLLVTNPHLSQFPLVENEVDKYLLGSVQREVLVQLLNNHVSLQRFHTDTNWKRKTERGRSKKKKAHDRLYPVITGSPMSISYQLPSSYESPYHSPFKSPSRSFTSFYEETTPTGRNRRKRSPSPSELTTWKLNQLKQEVDLLSAGIEIDPAPFQLVESSTLLTCHSLFVMVGIHIAYVTNIGELVGVVGLKELRQAMEDAKKGRLGVDEPLEDVVVEPGRSMFQHLFKRHDCSLILETTELDESGSRENS